MKQGKTCTRFSCPLCTKWGRLLVLSGILIMFVMPNDYSWIGLIPVVIAYLLPLLKKIRSRS